jgi:hypothetical protein
VLAPTRLISAFVDFAPVSDLQHEYNKYVLLERAKNAVVSHSILPEMVKFSPEPLADLAWIV